MNDLRSQLSKSSQQIKDLQMELQCQKKDNHCVIDRLRKDVASLTRENEEIEGYYADMIRGIRKEGEQREREASTMNRRQAQGRLHDATIRKTRHGSKDIRSLGYHGKTHKY
mmetsp:Transcript_45004/g.54532  ORF Transcript_45004/g.54532 Transcript_45004/m.54532 type:complete len:112 (+) Transcript_45004:811-1146(+)